MEMNLIQKLAEIRKMAAAVKKNEKGYNYTYPSEEAVLANVTAGMNKYHVSLHVEIDPRYDLIPFEYTKYKKNKEGEIISEEKVNEWAFKGIIHYVWKNDENPSDIVEANWPIVGQQADVSQAFGSGMTYCQRYFLLKYFQSASTKDDPDAYRSKQKALEEAENTQRAQDIVAVLHVEVNDFLEKHASSRDGLTKIIKKYVIVNGKPSADYFKLTDPDIAAAMRDDIKKYIESEEKKGKKNEQH